MTVQQNLSFYRDTPGPYSALLQKRDRGEPITDNDLRKSRSAILSDGLTKPFVYSVVRNKDGSTVGYLVGTMHHCNEEMLHNFTIRKVVESCSYFFMEILPSWYASKSPSDLIGLVVGSSLNEPLARLGMDFQMDCSLCMLARSNNIDCEALATNEEQEIREKLLALPATYIKGCNGKEYLVTSKLNSNQTTVTVRPENEVAKGTCEWNCSRTEEEKALETAEYYQRGSSIQLHSFLVNTTGFLQETIFNPNILWAKRSIIPAFTQLSTGKRPICVLLGAEHLFGQAGSSDQISIIKILRENGFTVTRVASERDIVMKELSANEATISKADKDQTVKLLYEEGARQDHCKMVAALVLIGALATVTLSCIASYYRS